jgi:hypothetical protein
VVFLPASPQVRDEAALASRPPHDGRRAGYGRLFFAAAYLAGQAALIGTAGARSDHIFGFRMFPEASTLEIHLFRETGPSSGTPIRALRGDWSAHDRSGQLRHFSWRDRVRDPVLGSIDVRVFASYGVDAQLARLGHALDDVAEHIADDAETRQLRAEVVVRKNGAAPVTVQLTSLPRRL